MTNYQHMTPTTAKILLEQIKAEIGEDARVLPKELSVGPEDGNLCQVIEGAGYTLKSLVELGFATVSAKETYRGEDYIKAASINLEAIRQTAASRSQAV